MTTNSGVSPMTFREYISLMERLMEIRNSIASLSKSCLFKSLSTLLAVRVPYITYTVNIQVNINQYCKIKQNKYQDMENIWYCNIAWNLEWKRSQGELTNGSSHWEEACSTRHRWGEGIGGSRSSSGASIFLVNALAHHTLFKPPDPVGEWRVIHVSSVYNWKIGGCCGGKTCKSRHLVVIG